MTESPKETPYEILKINLDEAKFQFFSFDNELKLTKEAHKIINHLSFEYYKKLFFQENRFLIFKNFFFKLDYRKHKKKYPPLIDQGSFQFSQFTKLTPGDFIDRSLLIGYFKDIKTPEQTYFLNIIGKPIEPVTILLETVKVETQIYFNSLGSDNSKESAHKLEQLVSYFRDLEKLHSICILVCELYDYALSIKLPQLKSGHLISFISGLYYFLSGFRETASEMGLAAIQLEKYPPILSLINKLLEILRDAVFCFTIDLLKPAALSIGKIISIEAGEFRLLDQEQPETFLLSKIFDWILNLFKREIKEEEPNKEEIKEEPKQKEISEEKFWPKIECRPALDILNLLDKFLISMESDLSPEYSKEGMVTNFKNGFEGFNKESSKRRTNTSNFVFNGKIIVNDASDPRVQDQMIVDSTYWLYDRINKIIRDYPFRVEGIRIDLGRRFIEEIKKLISSDSNEPDKINKYGTFQQFRTNVRRLFSLNTLHSKYYNIMNQIGNLLNSASSIVQDEEEKLFKK